MSLVVERKVAAHLRGIRPREAFVAELLGELMTSPHTIYLSEDVDARPRTRWLVAGAVAGVVSATGAVYLAARRHHHRGAA